MIDEIRMELTEEELEYQECLRTPRCVLESYFHNFDSLGDFSESRLGEIRLYQLSTLSYENIVDYKVKGITAKDQFRLRKNLGDNYSFGARLYGKCEHDESELLLSNGSYVKFKDLIGQTVSVISFNDKTLKLEKSKATIYDNGIKDCFKITLKSGKEITVTENHPLFVGGQWREAKTLNIGELIATPREIKTNNNMKVDENIAKLLGYLLGDGSTSQNGVGFTNINPEIIKEYQEICGYFNCDLRQNGISYFVKKKKNYIVAHYQKGIGFIKGHGSDKNNITKIVKRYNIDKLAKNKEIPSEVFTWKNQYIAILLNRLFACDGHNNPHGYIEMGLASKKMIYQIQSLLLRFGIYSSTYYKKAKCNDKFFDCWTIQIAQDYNKFLDRIGIFTKDSGYRKIIKHMTSDVIPKEIIKPIYSTFSHKKELSLKSLVYQDNPTRSKCHAIATKINNKEFLKIVNSDIYWDKIIQIETICALPTVAVSVPKNNTYISNNIISHNTLIALKLDIMNAIEYCEGEQIGFTSESAEKIRTVMDDIRQGIEEHPFYKLYNIQSRTTPTYNIRLNNGCRLIGLNMDLESRKAGKAFFGKHYQRLYIEEASAESEQVYKQRLDSQSELGAVVRCAGMTNFVPTSAAGKQFYDSDNKMKVVHYPQYINSRKWDAEEKRKKIQEFDGEDSYDFKVFVAGEIMRDGISEMDMERVIYKDRVMHKTFELRKEDYRKFRDKVVVVRPNNADSLWINADIGDGRGGSEIIIHSMVEGKLVYLYNITVWEWTEEEQEELFKWLGQKLGANVIGLDCGEGVGRGLFRSLEKVFGPEVMVRYAGNDKIIVDYKRDDKGELLRIEGQPIPEEENASNWAFKTLRKLFYENQVIMGIDYKLHKQLENVVSVASQDGTKRRYFCANENDHLFDAHKILANSYWHKFGVVLDNKTAVNWGIGVLGGKVKKTDLHNQTWGLGALKS